MNERIAASGSLRRLKAGTAAAAGIGGTASLVFAFRWFGEVSRHCGTVRFYEYILGAVIVGGWLIFTAVGWKLGSSGRRGPTIIGLVLTLLAAAGMAIAVART